MRTLLLCALAGAVVCGWTTRASAQAFYGGEFERARSNGTTVPYDGAPWSHRYNYSTGALKHPRPARQ